MKWYAACCLISGCLFTLPTLADCRDIRLTHTIDHQPVWQDISTLASAAMEGRESGHAGARKAALYIQEQFHQIGLLSFSSDTGYLSPFTIKRSFSGAEGANVVGWIEGNKYPDTYIVVTAHYDHIGKQGGKIFFGADDNASGVAALLALARYVAEHGSAKSIIFLATDAEEKGLFGAKAFVADPPVPLSSIQFNLNLDMLAQGSKRKRLYISSGRTEEALDDVIEAVIAQAGLCLVKNHRRSESMRTHSRRTNWTRASDHGAFAAADIPYLYIGVGEHRDYHKETDTIERIPKDFFFAAVETSLKVLIGLDRISESETEKTETD